MTHKGENYSVKIQKYYFCNETGFFTPIKIKYVYFSIVCVSRSVKGYYLIRLGFNLILDKNMG